MDIIILMDMVPALGEEDIQVMECPMVVVTVPDLGEGILAIMECHMVDMECLITEVVTPMRLTATPGWDK
jgi:hypothetical protein